MRRIMDAYDDQLGKKNPLLNQARNAHSERVNTFDPNRDSSAAGVRDVTKAALNTENTGYTLYNKLFNSSGLKRGEGLGVVKAIKAGVGSDPEAMSAMREGALHRIFRDPLNGEPISPQKASTNLKQVLSGPMADTYRELFTPEQLRALSRQQALANNVARSSKIGNPPNTSYKLESDARRRWAMGVGATLGSGAAYSLHGLGLPVPPLVGEGLGAAAGYAAGRYGLDPFYAAKARRFSSPGRYPVGPSQLPNLAPAAEEMQSSQNRARGGYFGGGGR
jgi:hypothetical protein